MVDAGAPRVVCEGAAVWEVLWDELSVRWALLLRCGGRGAVAEGGTNVYLRRVVDVRARRWVEGARVKRDRLSREFRLIHGRRDRQRGRERLHLRGFIEWRTLHRMEDFM